jgi:NAD(P)-dependent dehydrogenase (short-subunit alcohol dehydrogenase family)
MITISSGVSTLTPANTSVYRATKAAVDAVTRSLARELGPRKIRVNATNPGMVETEGVHDIAPAVVFFASGDSAHHRRNDPDHRRIALTTARERSRPGLTARPGRCKLAESGGRTTDPGE